MACGNKQGSYTPCQTIISLVWFFLNVLLPLITCSYNANWIEYHRSRFSAWVYSNSVLFLAFLRLPHCSVAFQQNLQIIRSKRKNDGTYADQFLCMVIPCCSAFGSKLLMSSSHHYMVLFWASRDQLWKGQLPWKDIYKPCSVYRHLTDMSNIYHVSSLDSTH